MSKKIVIGSAHCYRMDYNGTIPKLEDICKEENRYSYIKNGASLEYTPTKVVESDDLGLVQKAAIQSEETKVKCGLMTFDAETIKYLIATARTGDTTETGKTLTKIGGIGNDDETSYLWCLHHEDKKDGDIWVVCVGKHNGGVTVEFKPDGASVIDMEIDAEPLDNEGTKIYYFEEAKTVDSGTSGKSE